MEVEVSDEEMRSTAYKIVDRDMFKRQRSDEDKRSLKFSSLISWFKSLSDKRASVF